MAKQPAKERKAPQKAKKPDAKPEVEGESAGAKAPLIDAIPAEVYAKPAPAPEESTAVPPVEKPETPAPAPTETQQPQTAPARKSTQQGGLGVFPLFLGGIAAGAIGFAVASLSTPAADTGLADDLAAQQGSLNALEDRVAALDLSAVSAAQADLEAQLSSLSNDLGALADRITALEERPTVTLDADGPDATALNTEIEALRAQITEMTGAAATELEEARAAAAAIEENAAAAARNAAARAALSRVQVAMESGAPLGAALNDLEDATGEPAPAALAAARDGVPTLSSLQAAFPDAARAALATARREGVAGEETTGFGAFLRSQFDVRSTTPQEGDSADAILSRAEAAMGSGRLSDALAEISALPEVARAEMSEWLAIAETRADAVAAVDILSTSLSEN
ncbi:MAG: hypothetical protein AAFU41_13940 [Pseudomonadota bacterium]